MRHFSGEFEGVRLLMLDELDAISGGDGEDTDDGSNPNPDPDPNDDIIVTGQYPPGSAGYIPPVFEPYPGDWTPGPFGGGYTPPFSPPPPETPCEQDKAEDDIATGIANLIKSQPDWNEREYGALVVRYADGSYGVTGLTRGETVAEASARAVANGLPADTPPQTNFGSPPPNVTVVGEIHSHPDIGYDAAGDILNQYPSVYAGGGDYYGLEPLMGKPIGTAGSSFADDAHFTDYILGPDGVLREFSRTDGPLNPATDPHAADRSNLEYDRPCH